VIKYKPFGIAMPNNIDNMFVMDWLLSLTAECSLLVMMLMMLMMQMMMTVQMCMM